MTVKQQIYNKKQKKGHTLRRGGGGRKRVVVEEEGEHEEDEDSRVWKLLEGYEEQVDGGFNNIADCISFYLY